MSDVAKEARVSVKEAQSATGQSRRRTRARRPVIPPSGPSGEASLDGVATTWSCLVEHLSLPPNRNDDGRRRGLRLHPWPIVTPTATAWRRAEVSVLHAGRMRQRPQGAASWILGRVGAGEERSCAVRCRCVDEGSPFQSVSQRF